MFSTWHLWTRQDDIMGLSLPGLSMIVQARWVILEYSTGKLLVGTSILPSLAMATSDQKRAGKSGRT